MPTRFPAQSPTQLPPLIRRQASKPMIDFEAEFTRHLDRFLTGTPANLRASIEYSALAPGKRIRPRLLMAVGHLLGAPAEPCRTAGIALELIHCFTLIHDDLPCMDDDDFRRGRPSNHKIHGEGLALLAGDAIIPLAIEMILDTGIPATAKLEVLRAFVRNMGAAGVIGGQAKEMLLTAKSSLEDLRAMHAAKTGALFVAAFEIGRIIGGVDETATGAKALKDLATALGHAFQVSDDVDDSETDPGPISILSHLDRREAIVAALEPLRTSQKRIQDLWPDTTLHGPLLHIAAGVEQKLESQLTP